MITGISTPFLLLFTPPVVVILTFIFQKYMYGEYIFPDLTPSGWWTLHRTKNSNTVAEMILISMIPGFGLIVFIAYVICFIILVLFQNPFKLLVKLFKKLYNLLAKVFEI